MAEQTKIEWTDRTFNPWTGCTKISPGCDNCYAEAWSKRSGHVIWGKHPRKRTTESYWRGPVMWQRKAAEFIAEHGRRPRVFCASLADVFDNKVDPQWRADLFELIKATPSLDWQLLTKRPQNIKKMLPLDWGMDGYHNVWLGFTAEDQVHYNQRKRFIAEIPAAIWFVSYEPAIGPVRLIEGEKHPDWLIVGGESGHGVRSMEPQWARDIIADCREMGVAPFFKQWGAIGNNPLVVEQGVSQKKAKEMDLFGKGGGLIDGQLIREFPKVEMLNAEYSVA